MTAPRPPMRYLIDQRESITVQDIDAAQRYAAEWLNGDTDFDHAGAFDVIERLLAIVEKTYGGPES